MPAALLTIQELVERTSDLPTIPAAAIKVIRESESSTSSASSLAATLAADQSLSARVLRLSNSAYYGLSRQVSDLPEAVVVLGMRCIRNLTLVAATFPWMSRTMKGYELGPKAMWSHALAVAVGAQEVAKRANLRCLDAAFTAGLLHDIGKVALSVWLENKVCAVVSLAERESISFDEAERQVLGFDHAEVGYMLAGNWNLPVPLAEAVRFHHRPNETEPSSDLADCVHLADALAMALGLGIGADGLMYHFYPESLARLGLASQDWDVLAGDLMVSYEKYETMFGELLFA